MNCREEDKSLLDEMVGDEEDGEGDPQDVVGKNKGSLGMLVLRGGLIDRVKPTIKKNK